MAIQTPVPVSNLHLSIAGGESLDVREFMVEESLSRPFDVRLIAMSASADVDFEAAVGQPARFELRRASIGGGPRAWGGLCASAELIAVEDRGLSTYEIRIMPRLWLLTQRRNYRVFQDKSELDVVLEVLQGWGIQPKTELDAASYAKRRFRVQYAESDFDFVSRLMEDIGVTYHFVESEGESTLVLVDAPNKRSPAMRVPFISTPGDRLDRDYVTDVRSGRQIRPGRYTQSDVDYRKALDYPLAASVTGAAGVEAQLERYHHNYGSFLWKTESGGDTPSADDRGAARTDECAGRLQVQRRLEAQRVEARACSFRTTAHDLAPGVVFTIVDHPRGEIGAPLLVVRSTFSGLATGSWSHRCDSRYTDVDYRPALVTPKPKTLGVESATVTGPAGEEIHTDEFGRVRVRFHWDREARNDESSSCWIPSSQPWAGAGFGAISLPRVGQEVLVDFLGADPDRPVVIGRVFTKTMPPPYELPKYKMVGGMRSETYPRPRPQAGGGAMGGGPTDDVAGPSSSLARRAEVSVARPVGGGLAPARLGGDAGEDMALPSSGGRTIMPGSHGAQPAPLDQLRQAVTRMKAQGPDGEDAARSGNGVMSVDRDGGQQLYLQAQRDLQIAVKRDMVGSVAGNRAFEVLGNDYELIEGFQATGVVKDRVVEVNGIQRHTVIGDIFVETQASETHTTKLSFTSKTTEGGQIFDAKAGIAHVVDGKSKIYMLPDGIVIDAPVVFINPGPAMMAALEAGMSVADAAAAAKAQADAAAARAAARAQLISNVRMLIDPMSSDQVNRMAENMSNGTLNNDKTYIDDSLRSMGLTSGEDQAQALWEANRGR